MTEHKITLTEEQLKELQKKFDERSLKQKVMDRVHYYWFVLKKNFYKYTVCKIKGHDWTFDEYDLEDGGTNCTDDYCSRCYENKLVILVR